MKSNDEKNKAPRELDVNEIAAVSGGTEETPPVTVNKAKMADKSMNKIVEYIKS
ncbi:MAG TPA: hypothetical protein VIN36_01245 [Thiobacillus sp.]|jgi:hypothetical protein